MRWPRRAGGRHGRAGPDPAGARVRRRRRHAARSAGLYAAALPPLAAALFASSPYLQTGPVALTSLLTFGALADRAPAGQRRLRASSASCSRSSSASCASLIGLLRGGLIAHLMSEPMLMGFVPAGAVLIAASQLPAALGVEAEESEVDRRPRSTHAGPADVGAGGASRSALGSLVVVLARPPAAPAVPRRAHRAARRPRGSARSPATPARSSATSPPACRRSRSTCPSPSCPRCWCPAR